MSWKDYPSIDIPKIIAVFLVLIAVAFATIVICFLVLGYFGVSYKLTVMTCTAVLLVELALFRFAEETIPYKLFFKNEKITKTYIVRKER